MRKSEVLVLLIACLLFAIGMPSQAPGPQLQVRQEQEASEEQDLEIAQNERFYIEFKARTPSENEIADIMWLREAAQIALEAGIPYFRVKNQLVRQELDKNNNFRRQVVEGEIQLDNDPFNSDFDANEIMALSLPNNY